MLNRMFRQRAAIGHLVVFCGFLLSGRVLGEEGKPASGTAGLAGRIQEIIGRPALGYASFGSGAMYPFSTPASP
jgi:hypothetical protein